MAALLRTASLAGVSADLRRRGASSGRAPVAASAAFVAAVPVPRGAAASRRSAAPSPAPAPRLSTRAAAGGPDGGPSSSNTERIPFGSTRLDVILIGTALIVVGFVAYYGLIVSALSAARQSLACLCVCLWCGGGEKRE